MLPPFRDLTPRRDVKGGSPRTPVGGVPVRDYQEYVVSNGNGVWKAIATGLGGLVCGLLVAWFTAFMGKGVNQKEMEDYIRDHSPYAYDKQVLTEHNSIQDNKIGSLEGKQERTVDRVNKLENDVDKCDRELQTLTAEMKTKMGTVADMLEQKVKK